MARDQWSGRLGFILAASGSAIGLGNLWKFPYITWKNQGGAFVLVYLVCIALVGMPIMCAEILVGRRTQASVSAAFGKLGNPRWGFIGWLGILAAFTILGFYSVIAGWSLKSFWQCMTWSISEYTKPADDAFSQFLADPTQQICLTLGFSVLTALIVYRGISGGIERATKILMPVLLLILVGLFLAVTRLDGFGEALRFVFAPDFSEIRSHGILEALGHAFFTLSLGMGAMITYGSYMKKSERILPTAWTVVVLDTVIAVVACLIMFTIIFSVEGMREKVGGSTVGMLFITLPELFYTQMPGGTFLGPLFFVLVAFAALSSTISLLEVIVSLGVDRFGWKRSVATGVSAAVVFGLSTLCALSLGADEFFSKVRPFGQSETGFLAELNHIFVADKAGMLSLLDHVSANWLLPLGGLFITLYVGWVLPARASAEELRPGRTERDPLFRFWLFFVRFVCPVAIGWIIASVITGSDFS